MHRARACSPLVTVSSAPRLYVADDVATPQEIAHILALAATTAPQVSQGVHPVNNTTGLSFELPVREAPVRALARRIAAITRMPNALGNLLRFQQHAPGHYDPLHTDANTQAGYTLIATAMVYLTDVTAGGEIHFPRARVGALRVLPRAGRLVAWFNHLPDGSQDPASQHESLPVIRGTQATVTSFIYRPLADAKIQLDAPPPSPTRSRLARLTARHPDLSVLPAL